MAMELISCANNLTERGYGVLETPVPLEHLIAQERP
jgi:hypothetical protein